MNTNWVCATAIAVAVSVCGPLGTARAAWTETVLHSFKVSDGAEPFAGLIFDAAGNLYGTTFTGGVNGVGRGMVFKLAPPAAGQTTWTETVLHRFRHGVDPLAGLIFDAAGNLYGTVIDGAAHGYGAVFALTPPAAGRTAWTETVLHSFKDRDGADPQAGLIFDAAGNLYGTTAWGGHSRGLYTPGNGVVFELAPPAAGQTTWTHTVLHGFKNTFEKIGGAFPEAGLIFDAAGDLYGTTVQGGTGPTGGGGLGTVFELTPTTTGQTTWTETVLHRFTNSDGAYPLAGLVFDAAGNLYGTTSTGGTEGHGTVFELTPPVAGQTAWTETVLHSFTATDGDNPQAGLIFDAAGNLYGTTYQGGAVATGGGGRGVVFELTPNSTGIAWGETVLYSFCVQNNPCPDGSGPVAGVIFDAAGNLYGTTTGGGADDYGTVFELTPPTIGQTVTAGAASRRR